MFAKNKRISLLGYWTSRYFITLLLGLLIIGLISALWIRHSNIEDRLNLMTYIAEDTVDRILQQESDSPRNPVLGRPEQSFRELQASTYVLNAKREVISTNKPPMQRFVDLSSLTKKDGIQQFTDKEDYYAVQRKITYNAKTIGYVIVVDKKKNITKVDQQYGQLIFIILFIAFLGWCAIYTLSKRLAKPINDVSKAAFEVQQGNYSLSLPSPTNVQEVDELVMSFKEMAAKLEQLEQTRTELLAGVTHELKTPVTSISGLLQAVKDGVVEGDDAKEFLNMAMAETTKMKTLVGDLLSFNSYAVNAIPLKLVKESINTTMDTIIIQWQAIQAEGELTIHLTKLAHDVYVHIDPVRIQQIFTNLFNNAAQAMNYSGTIYVILTQKDSFVEINIKDEGSGILMQDQPYIFERFYRGENKKFSTRGLGLGLPLSKMMAKSLGGDLTLIKSDEKGSTFSLLLPISTDIKAIT